MSFSSDIRALSHRPVLRGLALVILFTFSTRLDPLSSSVLDADIWWHLRDGNAIVAQHAVPHQGWFTQYSSHPWVDYSWGSEVVMSRFYHWFGLMGLVALRSLLEIAITLVLFLMLRSGLRSFWQAAFFTAAGMWAIHHCLGMQPMLISVLVFTIELAMIFEAYRRKVIGPLLWSPPLFLLWANFHIQFIYGLFVLLLLTAVTWAVRILPQKWASKSEQTETLALVPLIGVAAASVLATLVGPYSWKLYVVIFHYVRSSAPYMIISELQALNFRVPEHYVLVLIVAAAFFVLGWRRSRDPFKLALLIICTVVGFRMTRDSWFCALPALAIIGDRDRVDIPEKTVRRLRKFAFAAATALATIAVFVLLSRDSKTNNATLAQAVAAYFPVNASSFVRARWHEPRIYNEMNWGGFLIWALPDSPVAIDNRPDLYGDETLTHFYLMQQGLLDWSADPDLNTAQVVILSRQTPLAKLLMRDRRFHLVYEDPLAVIFTSGTTDVSGHQGVTFQSPGAKKVSH